MAEQDLNNNVVIAWRLSSRNDLQLVMDTLDLVAEKRNFYRTIFHSDQGFQYASHAYHNHFAHLGVIGSHSRKGHCHDNTCIESFFLHVKSEGIYLNHFESEEELQAAIEDYIYFYNYQRFQKRLCHLAELFDFFRLQFA
ncbi:DDE-type integrase/transposase/recombinase [Bacillus sp. TH44]|nr:DDE-type integrase/transposase/recombinase [Bacillus sp. TH45]MBK5359147.1 DDE-type integrase/transposase/recombinase [Bacillus sp. TH44]MBK5362665.1 DDE-type integrase/transposase/recombinase [Bacillus sp. TH50]